MNLEEMNPNKPKKQYTGVWIPFWVMDNPNLSPIDKLIYAEIACFRNCYASNEWLAKRCGVGEKTARRSIIKLIDMGYVLRTGFNGRKRYLQAVENSFSIGQFDQSATANLTSLPGQKCPTNNKDYNNNLIYTKESPTAHVENSDVVSIYKYYCDKAGKSENRFRLTDKRKQKIKKRLTEFNVEQIKQAIDNALNDDYYSGKTSNGWVADLDYIIRSTEITERLSNMTPRSDQHTESFNFKEIPL